MLIDIIIVVIISVPIYLFLSLVILMIFYPISTPCMDVFKHPIKKLRFYKEKKTPEPSKLFVASILNDKGELLIQKVFDNLSSHNDWIDKCKIKPNKTYLREYTT